MTSPCDRSRFAATRRSALLLLFGFAALVGCDRKESAQKTAQDRPVRTGTATIRGTVTLQGNPPIMRLIKNEPCHPGAQPIFDESVVTDVWGNLQNVIVYLETPPRAAAAIPAPAVLDQRECRYVPHVLALRTGQTLRVTNSDPTLHNVHGMCDKNPAFNFAQVAAGITRDLSFSQAERFAVRCDVHPWMRAYVQVFDHPWFAVTAKDGTFQIDNVPAGTYTLVAWHEKYGEVRTTVHAADGKTASAHFNFQSGL